MDVKGNDKMNKYITLESVIKKMLSKKYACEDNNLPQGDSNDTARKNVDDVARQKDGKQNKILSRQGNIQTKVID